MFKLHLRGFTSLLLSLSFLVAIVSGLVLWLVHSPQPGGALLLGIGKGAWKTAHVNVSLLMVVAAAAHFWLNWSIYRSYLWQRAAHRLNQKKELAWALAITVAVACTASLGGHNELQRLGTMSPKEIAQKTGQPLDQIVDVLKQGGIAVHDPADSLLEIARHNNVSPGAIIPLLPQSILRGIGPGGPGHH